MGCYYGYHRVSTVNQKEDRGVIEIERFCKDNNINLERNVYVDKQTGKNFDRPRYTVLKEDILRSGDILIITEVDRLGRNKQMILNELRYFKEKGVRVMILELPTTLINFNNNSDKLNILIIETIQNLIIELYACFAESEVEKRGKRQREGIEAMKLRGDWDKYGRPAAVEFNTFVGLYKQVLKGEIKPRDVRERLDISISTYYRYRKEYEEE